MFYLVWIYMKFVIIELLFIDMKKKKWKERVLVNSLLYKLTKHVQIISKRLWHFHAELACKSHVMQYGIREMERDVTTW